MKAVFLDRDGTVIVDPPDLRVDSVDEIELFPDSVEALKLLAERGFGVVFISNQAGIGERRFTEEQFWVIQNKVIELLAPSGVKVLKTYICPHVPEDNCDCRKPKPKMILDAAREFDIDLANSYMVGDRETDVLTGLNAGTKTILVRTGNSPVESPDADYQADDLQDAARYIATQG
jgi:histidinol-phosphate phosphatase family protein